MDDGRGFEELAGLQRVAPDEERAAQLRARCRERLVGQVRKRKARTALGAACELAAAAVLSVYLLAVLMTAGRM